MLAALFVKTFDAIQRVIGDDIIVFIKLGRGSVITEERNLANLPLVMSESNDTLDGLKSTCVIALLVELSSSATARMQDTRGTKPQVYAFSCCL